jgi:HPt (histidine-containing phosphotransfer) domain-containing protein
MATESALAVLDHDRLHMSAGGDPELLGELVALYVSDSEAKLAALADAVAEGDAVRCGDIAHGIKGASAAVGAQAAAAAFHALETRGRSGELSDAHEALQAARAAWRCARDALLRAAA